MKNHTMLGQLTQVAVRDVWSSEASQFTPWLATGENLGLLAETIGIDLECEAQEKNVGPFRADILCKDTVNGAWVLIENQLERTDHNHLGQLLTYAAGLKAVTIVWIAERFTEEHRAALDWLNEITGEDISFFGLEIELWRIGESPVAPKFNLVCKPNDWSKTVTDAAQHGDELTDTKLLQREYWSALREMLLDVKSIVRPQKPPAQHWTNFSIGRSNFYMVAVVNTRDDVIGCSLVMVGPHAKAHFSLLQREKEVIEAEIGEALEWEELPNKKESRVSLRQYATDPTKRNDWPRQHGWMRTTLEKFHRVFVNRVRLLDAAEAESAAEV